MSALKIGKPWNLHLWEEMSKIGVICRKLNGISSDPIEE